MYTYPLVGREQAMACGRPLKAARGHMITLHYITLCYIT